MADEHNIELTPDIKVESVLKSAKRLRAAIQSALDGVEGKQLDSRLQSMQNKMSNVAKKSQEVEESLSRLSDRQVPTKMYDDVLRRLQETGQEIDKLEEKMNRYLETGGKKSAKQYQQMEYDLSKLIEKQDQLNLSLEHLEKAKLDYMPASASEEAQKLVAEQEQLNNQMRIYNESWDGAIAKQEQMSEAAALREQRQELTGMNQTVIGLTSTLRGLGRVIPGVSTRGIMATSMIVKGVAKLSTITKVQLVAALNTAKAAFAKLFATIAANPIVAIIAAIIAAIVLLGKQLKKVIDETKKQVESLGKLLENLGKKFAKSFVDLSKTLGKGFLGVYVTSLKTVVHLIELIVSKVKSLQSTITDGLQSLAAWNDGSNEVNTALSNLTSSLEHLKTALATAFAPIIVAIEPAITRLIDLLAEATTYIGMFIAMLTGATSFKKAIKQQKDYAKSLDGTAKSAKAAGGQLASFDKLNVINSDSGSGGSDIASMFEDLALEDIELPEWLTDLYELGRLAGTTLRDLLNSIPWGKIKSGAEAAAQGIADFVNGMMSIDGLGRAVGASIGELINTFSKFINTLLTQTYWKQIGGQIADTLLSFVDTIEWGELGDVFSNFLNKVAELLLGIFDDLGNAEGKSIGASISEMLQHAFGNIEWGDVRSALAGMVQFFVGLLNGIITPENFALIGQTLGETINTIFTTIGELTSSQNKRGNKNGIDFTQWGVSIADGIANLFSTIKWDEAGQALSDLSLGLLDMLLTAISNIDWDQVGDKLVEFISNIDWVSLANKAKEISEKLREALEKIWAELADSEAFDQIIDLIVDFLSEKKNWEKAFKKVKNEVVREVVFGKIKEWFKGLGEEIISYIFDPMNTALKTDEDGNLVGENIFEGIAKGLARAATGWDEGFLLTKMIEKLKEVFGIHSPATEMEPIGENIALGIFEGFNLVNIGEKIGVWAESFKTTISTKFNEIKNAIIETFIAIKNGIKSPINGVISIVEGMVNRLIDGLNWLIEKLNSVSFDITNPFTGESYSFGVKLPALDKVVIPRLAQGAVIPPNKEFLAMLGDQKSGTNIEAPLETIKQALLEVLRNTNAGGEYHIHVDVDGREITKVVFDQNKMYKTRTGRSMFV